ncbi:MAG TPA: hypothetical protein VK995_06140, partial [Oceanipulchritudo sp.]|nr:hypothetical protein [Oceanipulchritudo sp.]
SYGRPKMALEIYKSLERQKMPEQVQLAFLKRGIQSARDAGESGLAIEWQARVTPPPPPPEEQKEPPSESKTQ